MLTVAIDLILNSFAQLYEGGTLKGSVRQPD